MGRPRKNNRTNIKSADKPRRGRRSGKKEINSVTGMRDILPQDQKYWNLAVKAAEKIANDYGYGRLDTPILEQSEVFIRGVGKQTDLVEKEMFSFIDQGGDHLSLRPEGTAAAVRAYIQHGLLNQSQPVKMFYLGPMFRHEKPQAGRYRQLWQFGYEAIGEASPALDAQLILMGYNSLAEIGLEAVIQVNSLGCSACREEYKKSLVKYYRSKYRLLCDNCQQRLAKNPLRLLDCKEPGCQAIKEEAPQILDYLDEDCKKHFTKVLEYLDELDLPYVLNPGIVRGLDYYNRTIFEYWAQEDLEGKSALGGGGRYDGLVELLGGREETPACGLAMGLDRIVAKLREKEIAAPEVYQPEIFLAQLGESAKKKALMLYEKMRRKNLAVAQAFYKDSLKTQLELAGKLQVKYTMILGQKEIGDETIIIRDMAGGIQEIVDFKKAVEEISKRLDKYQAAEGITIIEPETAGVQAPRTAKKPKRKSTAGVFEERLATNDGADFNQRESRKAGVADEDFFGAGESDTF